MMPGDNQSKAGEIASEATTGTCQNCTVLNQSLDEYVAALLTLKQKIIDTDRLLSQYKEKCDELQKSQRESSKLHTQLDEVMLKIEPLEKQTLEYEQIKTELEKTKGELRSYQQKCEDADKLRAENAQTLTLKGKLEESLRNAEDTVHRQNLENEMLRAEKKKLMDDIQKTQDSLREYQETTEELENLKLENAKTLIMKENLENELLLLKETKFQQNNQINDLKNQKKRLEEILHTTQQRLKKLEKEFNKEKISTSSQTEAELIIDRGKVRKLLEELWHCVEPTSQTKERLLFNGEPTPLKNQLKRTPPQPLPISPVRRQISPPSPGKPSPEAHLQSPKRSSSTLKASPEFSMLKSSPQNMNKQIKEQLITPGRKRKVCSDVLEQINTWTDDANESSLKERNDGDLLHGNYCSDLEDIQEWFRPLPAALSPVRSPSIELVGLNDNQPEQEYQLNNGKPETLSSIHLDTLEYDTKIESSDIKDLKSLMTEKVEQSSVLLSPGNHKTKSASSDDDMDLQNASSDSQYMEVDDMLEVSHNCVGHNQKQTIKPGVERVENSLENDTKQTAVELLLMNQNYDRTQLKETKVTNDIKNLPENSVPQQHIEPDPMSTNSVESAESESSLGQPNEALTSKFKSISRLIEVNSCKRNEELESFTLLEIRTVADISTHDIQNMHSNKAANEDSSSKPTEYQKRLDERENGGACLLRSLKDEESSSEDEVFLGLKRKVRGIRSRSEAIRSEAITPQKTDVVCESKKCSSVKQMSKEEHQRLCTESRELLHTGLSTIIKSDDKRGSEPPENDKTVPTVCKLLSQESNLKNTEEDESENPRKISTQISTRYHERNDEMSTDALSSCTENLISEVSNHKGTSGDSALDSLEGTITPCHISIEPRSSSFKKDLENKGNTLLVPDLNTKAPITPTSCLSLGRVRTEMGPPLPPVVLPLTATPPRFGKHHTPLKPTTSSSILPTDRPKSPKMFPPVIESALPDASKMSPCLTTPSPSSGVPSSPLQFGSATPKHAVPVPGRLPSSALSSSPPSASQENSMQMLDTMYPELSARARTLNILRGNVNLNRAGNENGASPPSVNQISGNKSISSSSTAFTKTEQKPKRTGVNMLLPKSAKKLRLDNCSPAPPGVASPTEQLIKTETLESCQKLKSCQDDQKIDKQFQISDALAKIGISCFEELPVVKSHVFLGRISQVPNLIDEEKAVIADFCVNQSSAEELMSAILTKLKERNILSCEYLQALCRVYTGLCRKIGDYLKAHAFAYNILKEDLPDAPKLILFMVTTWPSVLFHETTLCKAIHTVAKLKADGEMLEYLTKYLHWDKSPPYDIQKIISSTLKALQEDKDLTFQKHDRHGDDLCQTTWEYIYTLDLLCTHMKWKWTHDCIIGKELWPIMNTWVTQPRPQQTPIRDISVAAVLRLIGRLGQLGMKQRLCKSVQNVAKAINLFGKHGITEDVPKEVQLSAVYAIYDLAPCNPKDALEALASWRSETTQPVPPAVTSCITQIGSLCRQIKS
ncbi:LOW QUALITY PROTEIN: little elongation complex subunit 1-like [Myxocyprinus asiaticus]|uniref:LOW QUALITY PROTEIN: little elongation complex subunit 1-like n=1 Tax=Myxocyprinus asiaticus TaxID=70543 RepID=UPI002221B706|nr:LOW QUALITY PROTEIN: little elongation complex subunit 1-like [Myxocyprinus asiaticus]